MRKGIIVAFVLLFCCTFGQQLKNIQSGEVLRYRIHYGFLNAGYATLRTSIENYNGRKHLYVNGTGQTTGAIKAFFKVNDSYESYIDYETGLPNYYVRNVSEGSYRQHLHAAFDQKNHSLILYDKKNTNKAPKSIKTVAGLQDLLSAFYYLRTYKSGKVNVGDVIDTNVWIDDEMFPFQLRVVKTEDIKTKFGTVNCLRIHPYVLSGRVFKSKEGVVLWVTNDANHIPIRMKAELVVGSLKADIETYKNLKFPIQFKK